MTASPLRRPLPLSRTYAKTLLFFAATLPAPGCGESAQVAEGSGSLRVLIEPEDTILDGLKPGEDVANIRDGWAVTYDKYVVVLGHVTVDYATDRDVTAEDERSFVVDLMQVPSNGEPIWKIEGLQPGRWNFGFELGGGAHGAKRHDTVEKADYDRVVDEDLTYLVRGQLTKEGGLSCPPSKYAMDIAEEPSGEDDAGNPCYPNSTIEFEFAVTAETSFTDCELDGISGFSISDGATNTVAITLHGDHPFFNGFPDGDEGGVIRLAQLWADADIDVDGKLDVEELSSQLIADLPQWDDRYQLGGAPGSDEDEGEDAVETLEDVLIAQLETQGHMNGEGECLVNGEGHDHD